jgi:hypothetical protein
MSDKKLEGIVTETVHDVLIARNNLMLEAVIAAYMDTSTPEETAEILEEHARQLREHG